MKQIVYVCTLWWVIIIFMLVLHAPSSCEDMSTDMDITACTGDIDPADPYPDQEYWYFIMNEDTSGCMKGECD